jgi:hypothetical protein
MLALAASGAGLGAMSIEGGRHLDRAPSSVFPTKPRNESKRQLHPFPGAELARFRPRMGILASRGGTRSDGGGVGKAQRSAEASRFATAAACARTQRPAAFL